MCLAWLGTMAVPCPSRAAPAPGTCDAAILRAERAGGIPAGFLSAISQVESGGGPAGGAPWPWTVNAAGTGHFYATKAQAIAAVHGFQAAGLRSIDAGCLQVNLMFHPDAFASLDEAFDPDANAAYAARLLGTLYQQLGSWPRAAAAYHSQTPAIGQAYAQKVLAAWGAVDPRLPYPARQGPPPGARIEPPETLSAAPAAVVPAGAPPPAMGLARSMAPAQRPSGSIFGLTGRGLAAYRALPVRLATRPPATALH